MYGAALRRTAALCSLGVGAIAGCAPRDEPARPRPPPGRPGEAVPSAADGQGRAVLRPADPVRCGTYGCWTVEWVAGEDGLAAGGGVVLHVSPFWGWTPPQTGEPGRPGFTSVGWSGSATISASDGAVPMTVVARVASGRVAPGDTVRFVYGDSSRGGDGSLARADIYAEDFEEFLVKTDGDGDGVFAAVLDPPGLRILADDPVRLAVAAPAVVAPGEAFTVAVHALDPRDNLAELPAGRLEIRARLLDGEASSPETLVATTAGRAGAGRRVEVSLRRPGLHRLEASLAANGGEPLRGANDLLLVERDSPFAGILWGDLHAHSALSDGTGTPEALYAYARDVAGLDVCAVTDHDAHGLSPLAEGGWEIVRASTRAAHAPGRFVTLLGYEWTSWTWGHRNVYYPGDEGEVFEFRDEDSDTPEELWARIAPFGGITIPHHPAGGPVAIDWSVPSDAERERVVEICSVHGSSEFAGAERSIYRPVAGAFVREALDARHRLGFLASGDTHDGHPGRRTIGAATGGLAAFRARERTREAVLDAIRARRTYGTSGPRILLRTDWAGRAPGEDVAAWPDGAITVRVAAPEPVQAVEVVARGGVVARAWGGGRRAVHVLEAVEPGDSPWAYVRVELGDGEVAWESPWWLAAGGAGP